MSNQIIKEVWIYLYADNDDTSAGQRCRKMLVGDISGPLVECRTVVIQKDTAYPANHGTYPDIAANGFFWLVPLVYTNGRESSYKHDPGLVQILGGVIDGLKAKNLDWPEIIGHEGIRVGTVEALDSGLVKLSLDTNCCVTVKVDTELTLSWEECLQKFGPPAKAHPEAKAAIA